MGILDGVFIVHMLQPSVSKTFGYYGENVFGKYVKSTLDKPQRDDIVFDVYKDDSLKQTTREKRGTGQRRQVLLSEAIPANWKSFLSSSENKRQLFGKLANAINTNTIETSLLYM